MQYVWKNLPTLEARKEYASRYLWGIDFDEKSTKISRAIMLIAGAGFRILASFLISCYSKTGFS
jgi:hypothetical protein